MAISSARFRCLAFVILIIAGIFISSNQVLGQSCHTNVQGIVTQCQKYVKKSGSKVPPSPGCCAVMKPVNIPCACKLVTKDVEGMVSMEKVVYVARSCGKTISAGTTCGSYTIRSA